MPRLAIRAFRRAFGLDQPTPVDASTGPAYTTAGAVRRDGLEAFPDSVALFWSEPWPCGQYVCRRCAAERPGLAVGARPDGQTAIVLFDATFAARAAERCAVHAPPKRRHHTATR